MRDLRQPLLRGLRPGASRQEQGERVHPCLPEGLREGGVQHQVGGGPQGKVSHEKSITTATE